ncbi:MAG: four-carbon acid sugar kinase family protein [Pseudomonadota bacterium]|nr:four-carbon acid sugar kinase family protein [Pseudomonadota bacterium]
MSAPIKLGCIADDFTGATDLANNLVRAGMRVVQTIGVPATAPAADIDAVVVALKSRTIAAADAVAESLAALRWLQAAGCEQVYFKVCSTFDSTPRGNIGPVTEALMDALGADFCLVTPAFPDTGRTVFKGYLFVGDGLLHESGMKDHPLTPMTDSSLVRVMQAQSTRRVGLIDHRTVASGAAAIGARIDALRAEGIAIAVADAVSNDDLLALGSAARGLPLVTAGSGLAIGLPANWGLASSPAASRLPPAQGACAIVSGSCSQATNRQVAHFLAHGGAALALEPMQLVANPEAGVQRALDWADQHLGAQAGAQTGAQSMLVYSTAEPQQVKAVQGQLGVGEAGALVERAIAAIARGLVARGVRQLVVAGGETSGAVVQALGVRQMQIGPQIDPGVPWTHALSDAGPLHLALKSGNFGGDDFFTRAFTTLQATA